MFVSPVSRNSNGPYLKCEVPIFAKQLLSSFFIVTILSSRTCLSLFSSMFRSNKTQVKIKHVFNWVDIIWIAWIGLLQLFPSNIPFVCVWKVCSEDKCGLYNSCGFIENSKMIAFTLVVKTNSYYWDAGIRTFKRKTDKFIRTRSTD